MSLHDGIHPPGQRQTPRADTHPLGRHPPVQCKLGYGQQAGGTHPTEMHSCFIDSFTHLQNDGVFYRSVGRVRSGDPGLSDGDAGDDPTGPPGDAVQDLRAVQHGGARGLPADRPGQGHHLQVQLSVGSRISLTRECQFQSGVHPIIWPKFAENCINMKKIGPRGEAPVQNFNAIKKIPRKSIENKSRMKPTFLRLQPVFESFP